VNSPATSVIAIAQIRAARASSRDRPFQDGVVFGAAG
jgi:hypothetical protein